MPPIIIHCLSIPPGLYSIGVGPVETALNEVRLTVVLGGSGFGVSGYSIGVSI